MHDIGGHGHHVESIRVDNTPELTEAGKGLGVVRRSFHALRFDVEQYDRTPCGRREGGITRNIVAFGFRPENVANSDETLLLLVEGDHQAGHIEEDGVGTTS